MLNLCLNQWLHCIHVSLEWRSKMLHELNMYDVMGVVNLKLEYLNLTSAGHCNTCMRPLFCCSDWMHNGWEKLIAQITHAIKLLTTIGIWNSQMGLNQHQWHTRLQRFCVQMLFIDLFCLWKTSAFSQTLVRI